MKCHEFQDLIESYLRETIEESRREQFEEHFFQCRKCFLGLKINEALQSKAVDIPLEEKPRLFALKVLRPMLAMAALFLFILSSVLLLQHDRRAGQVRELARFDLPLYHQGEIRGGAEGAAPLEDEFSRAMRSFQARDFRAALEILDQPAITAAAYPKYDFFRAISLLGADEADKAGEILDAIIGDMDPAYFDEALYYKGFVLLRQGKLQEARAQFMKLAGMLSPMSGKARAMVRKFDDLS
jgi:tetratricopeptide (TPR) repeat protein